MKMVITSFAPESYSLVRPIEVLIESITDSFVASSDANVSASGNNQQGDRLGPEPKRQLAVLESYLEYKPEEALA
jgi:hypothetical protein